MTRYRLDSQFHCSYLDSRGVPEQTREKTAGNYLTFISGDETSGDVISGDVISGDSTSGRTCAHDHFRHHHTAPSQIIDGWCFYTTDTKEVFRSHKSQDRQYNDQKKRSKRTARIYKTLHKKTKNWATRKPQKPEGEFLCYSCQISCGKS